MSTGTVKPHVHDLVGIGIGPFGLGLAALADPLDDVDAVFLDQAAGFSWHPGLLIEGTTLQVPFLADLVTMADPTSRYSFLNFLKATGRLYPFYIRESFYPLRAEYDAYCRWVAEQLDSLRWRRRAIEVVEEGEHLLVTIEVLGEDGRARGVEHLRTRHLALALGTAPHLPGPLAALAEQSADGAPVLHSAGYLDRREELLARDSVTVVGSGQSAAEVYRDLLEASEGRGTRVDWVTRSPRFFPMEYTKLTLEMTSPEYTDLHRSLPGEVRDRLSREQRQLHKGISAPLIDEIHELLYRLSAGGAEVPSTLRAGTAVTAARREGEQIVLDLEHELTGTGRTHRTGAVVAATGYAPREPQLLDALGERVLRDEHGRPAPRRDYTLDADGRLHVLGTEEHTHGVTAPDLGFGAWRASVVLAAITGREPYPIERRIAFQSFGPEGER
ncbi:lysine N(6)-hydroxylase/L-ornithine N(5)-oxygenase family protein [Brachybacterium squillarum]|uniref:lysine N(6)-hydroxylase/L-ornithine N(5)-oxygenase family protein n=1 Tax=Brachybacterium squillarum TaxID=661979 RepID=UPI002222A9C9|nr:SidA/IucD/PvdA family monooxygenase [Brachybacterium squillarum]MCW1805233.1 SidA/IucD/PvdA family monooxygenase [Brachybacterium squillarum]